jgi:hypothetical protein
MKNYRITYLIGKLDASTCPPAIVSALWPTFDGWLVTLSESECIVTVPEGTPEPLNLSPLIKIELLP